MYFHLFPLRHVYQFIYFRDIKPENILIHDEVEDGFYRVKVVDFGLARTLANCTSFATTMVGTPQYWAPEGALKR